MQQDIQLLPKLFPYKDLEIRLYQGYHQVAQVLQEICLQENMSRGYIFLGNSVLPDMLPRIKCPVGQEYLSYPRKIFSRCDLQENVYICVLYLSTCSYQYGYIAHTPLSSQMAISASICTQPGQQGGIYWIVCID